MGVVSSNVPERDRRLMGLFGLTGLTNFDSRPGASSRRVATKQC